MTGGSRAEPTPTRVAREPRPSPRTLPPAPRAAAAPSADRREFGYPPARPDPAPSAGCGVARPRRAAGDLHAPSSGLAAGGSRLNRNVMGAVIVAVVAVGLLAGAGAAGLLNASTDALAVARRRRPVLVARARRLRVARPGRIDRHRAPAVGRARSPPPRPSATPVPTPETVPGPAHGHAGEARHRGPARDGGHGRRPVRRPAAVGTVGRRRRVAGARRGRHPALHGVLPDRRSARGRPRPQLAPVLHRVGVRVALAVRARRRLAAGEGAPRVVEGPRLLRLQRRRVPLGRRRVPVADPHASRAPQRVHGRQAPAAAGEARRGRSRSPARSRPGSSPTRSRSSSGRSAAGSSSRTSPTRSATSTTASATPTAARSRARRSRPMRAPRPGSRRPT